MMSPQFIEEIKNLYRLKIPFEDLYTSVFLIKTEKGNVLVDSGTYDRDVCKWIIPALNLSGVQLKEVKYLIITHNHGDHVGGKAKLLELKPNMKIVTAENSLFINELAVYALNGHTRDCIGVLDMRSGTLIAGDAIQGYGVGRYRCLLESKEAYIATIEKIKQDVRIKNILFSHAYEPWYKDGVFGRENIEICLQDCIDYLKGEK